MPTATETKISKGQREALCKIAKADGTFHRIVGERLERDGLALPVSGLSNFLIGCNSRSANGWRLTARGAALVEG